MGDSIYIVDTRFGLHDKDLKNLRLVVKYSNKWVEHSELLLEVVPKWVLAPPKDGWKQFPPDNKLERCRAYYCLICRS